MRNRKMRNPNVGDVVETFTNWHPCVRATVTSVSRSAFVVTYKGYAHERSFSGFGKTWWWPSSIEEASS